MDWTRGHMHVGPEALGPTALSLVARLTLSVQLHNQLGLAGVFGSEAAGTEEVSWATILDAIRDRLRIHALHLSVLLARLQ